MLPVDFNELNQNKQYVLVESEWQSQASKINCIKNNTKRDTLTHETKKRQQQQQQKSVYEQ